LGTSVMIYDVVLTLLGLALFSHIIVSMLLIWRFATRTSYCTMPSEQAIRNARTLSEHCRSDGLPVTYENIIRFAVSTHHEWRAASWTVVYAVVGFVIWLIVVVAR